MKKVLFMLLLLLGFPTISAADIIVLKNGNRIETEKAWEEEGQIKFYRFGGVFGFPKEQVLRIENEQRDRNQHEVREKPVSTETHNLAQENEILSKVRELYLELMDFKDDALFHEVGFSQKYKYVEWQNKVMKTNEDPRSELLLKKGITPGDLSALGAEYFKSRGMETKFSRYMNAEFMKALGLL